MSSLDHLVANARRTDSAWNEERASRVLAGAQAKREHRLARDRFVRRSLVVAGVAAFVGFVLLRGAGASTPPAQATATASPTNEAIAVHASNDGGYARD